MNSKAALLFLMAILLVPETIRAQDGIRVNELLRDTAYTEKLPLPVATISVNMEQSEEIIKSANEKFVLTPENLQQIDSVLNRLSVELSTMQDQVNSEFLSNSSKIVIGQTRTEIESLIDLTNEYSEAIQEWTSELESESQKLERLIVIWDRTIDSDNFNELSETIKNKMYELEREIEAGSKTLKEELNKLVELELKINEFRVEFNAFDEQLEEALLDSSKNLLLPDSDPIWKLYAYHGDTVTLQSKIQNLVTRYKEELRGYFREDEQNLYIAAVILVLTQILFFIAKYQVPIQKIEDRSRHEIQALEIVKKPFFPALLIGLFIVFLFLSDKPYILDQLIFLVILIPFIVLLFRIIPNARKGLIAVLIIIFSLMILINLLFEMEILSRTLILIVNIIAILWTIRARKINFPHLEDHPFLLKANNFILRFSMIVYVLCLIGNVFGYYSLTWILLSGVITTVFFAVTVYFLELLINGSVIAVMNSPWGQQYRIIKKYKKDIQNRIQRYVIVLLSIFFIGSVLEAFKILDLVLDSISTLINTQYNIGNFTFTLIDIFLFILILLIASWISKFVRFILEEQVLFKSKKQKDLSASISSLVSFTIITIGFFIAALASGFPLDRITLLISAFGVGIGFGLQNIFNNLVSGIIIVFERPLQVGDVIEVGSLIGVVKKIGIRASTVRTFDGSEVIVPNGNLISNDLINWTLSDSQRRLIVKVGVAYGTDPTKVMQIMLNVAKNHEGVEEQPEPYVLFKEFGDSALAFELRCYTDSNDWIIILSDLYVEVNQAFKDAGITIPFPQRDLHIKEMVPEIARQVKTKRSAK